MSSTQELNKICNIAGYPMYSWAIAQLRKRSEILSKQNRSEDEINYLGNKGAWIRVVSSVNLEEQFLKYFKDQYGIDGNESTLAKNFILFGGTSTYESRLRSGINPGGSYALLGDTEVNAYGYRPMPGITSVTIESTGRMGSVRQATVNFRVSDKMQLDVMDALYFRPGFTLLIEYGHAKYIDNKGNLQSTETLMIDPFKTINKENIGIKISRNTQQSAGNYGGMLSIITSFNFSITQDGGYDCVLKTIAMGGVMGNYPINNLSILPNVYVESVKKYLDNRKKEAIAAARAEQEAIKALEAEKIQKSINDNWTDLGITDPVANLLYNIYPEWFQKNAQKNPLSSGSIESGGFQVAGGTSYTFNKTDVLTRVQTWKDNHKIVNQDKGLVGTVIFKDPGTSEEYNNVYTNDLAIFIEKSKESTIQIGSFENKYLAIGTLPKQKGDIYVKIDPLRILGNSEKGAIGAKVNALRITDGLNSGRYTTGSYDNFFDVINSVTSANPLEALLNVKTDLTYSRNGIEYYINVVYPSPGLFSGISKEEATRIAKEEILNNPETPWKVTNTLLRNNRVNQFINITLQNSDNKLGTFTIELGADSLIEGGFKNADLSIITRVIEEDNNQDLAKNKAADQLSEIERRSAQRIADINNKFELDANAKTLKAIANSQSALELMLRSIMIYAIDNNGKTLPKPKFIQDLFSEGAYSTIFKNGIPTRKTYTSNDFTRYIDGTMSAAERLEINLRYGNSAYLLSAENISDGINLLDVIPQVDIESMFNIISVPYGETADTLIEGDVSQKSVYISLGLFFMMLNHTGMLYNSNGQDDVLTPVTYVDFNPSTNYYLSSINQFSVDPFKYILPYYGTKDDYKKLFRKDILQNNDTIKLELSGSIVQPHSIFKFGQDVDKITPVLPNNKKDVTGNSNGYIGRTMDTMVNINHLLKIIKTRSTADDFGEAYFQSILENIIASFNKSTGYYNAFRLSYSDSANVYMIVDDHIQLKPDAGLKTIVGQIINNSPNSPEIPIQGKGSIARSFDIRTDISSRIASMIAISTNPGLSNQVGMGKNTSDFGVYNTGSHDRYMKTKSSDGSSNATSTTTPTPIQNNVQECQAAINFDTVVSSIYGLSSDTTVEYIKPAEVAQAIAYYKEKMSKIKNQQSGSVSAMIIPIKASITMDGFSGIYPFQLFTINENMLPYRYSSANLNNGKVAFSTARLTHNFSNNEWTTSMEGFMTFLKESDDQQTKPVAASDTIVVDTTGQAVISMTGTKVDDDIYKQILEGVGAKPTKDNMLFMYAWRQSEGGAAGSTAGIDAKFNPFNTTLQWPGAIKLNNDGVKAYLTLEDGIKATISTLLNSTGGRYLDIVNGLRGDVGLFKLSRMQSLAIWGTGTLLAAVADGYLRGATQKNKPIKRE